MDNYKYKNKDFITLPSYIRKLILIQLDIFVIVISFLISSFIAFQGSFLKDINYIFVLISIILTISIYFFTGQYKPLTAFISSRQFYFLFFRAAISVFLFGFINFFIENEIFSISFLISYCFILASLNCFLRIFLRDLLIFQKKSNYPRTNKRVAIYGAGSAGATLQSALLLSPLVDVVLFFDDSPNLWYRNLNGVPIQPPQKFSKNKYKIEEVLLAIPYLTRQKKRDIVKFFQELNINVLEIPSVEDLASGKTRIDSLKPIAIEDLLGRDRVKSNSNFMGPGINGENILITGAGGSIGSQLCREIINLEPKKLVLLELSEQNLYSINQEVFQYKSEKTEIISLLGDACDERFIKNLIIENKINTIIHSAAYKHVPLVERNSLSGMYNNIISTKTLCKLAYENLIENFLLISTDKAVRPTNIMGASKRLAELIVLAYGQKANERKSKNHNYIFTMVRFGNVLGSSGSVVPLFKKQIDNGGPITITHPEIIRYFMTIKEAAQLVLQAFALSKNQDLLLLDMGEPIKIYDLARQMIKLSGLSIKDKNNPNGDIEIIFTGLRSGEKLYEELLIDAEIYPTEHPLIYKANESFYNSDFLIPEIENLEKALTDLDEEKSLKILSSLVKEWIPSNSSKRNKK